MVFGTTGLGFQIYPYVNVSQLKNFAKLVQKRFALKLSMAQFAVVAHPAIPASVKLLLRGRRQDAR